MCLERVQEEVGDALVVEWKSYLLRPVAEPKTLERFRRYTESWLRPASQPDAGEFRVWATDEAPPSHSVPPAVAVKASARQGAFGAYHRALMHAYFARNLDVTSRANILGVASGSGLDLPRFEADLDDPALVAEVFADHEEGLALGVSAAPTIVLEGGFLLPGSQDRSVYRNIVQKLMARREAEQDPR